MKKIGIYTVTKVYNYGTKLQAYAMQEIFKQRGFYAEILTLSERKGILAKIKYYLKYYLLCLCFPYKKFTINKNYEQYINCQYNGLPNKNLRVLLKKRFEALDLFDSKYHIVHFIDKQSLKEHTKSFVVVVCGSDQIWHPILNRNDFWTLQLVSDGVRRMSYAPSLGVDELPESAISFFKKVLANIDYISVRELSGMHLLQNLTSKPVSVVLDPTLLVGRPVWDKILIDRPELTRNEYCLCYLLGSNPEHRKIISKTAKQLGLIVYNFSHFKEYNAADEELEGQHLYDISPTEFVGLVSKAKFVITDSFHCSVFSIMYHVPFMVLLRYSTSDHMSTNSRIYSLLGQLGLDSRIYDQSRDIEDIVNTNINFEEVEFLLAKKREESNRFIDEALKGL